LGEEEGTAIIAGPAGGVRHIGRGLGQLAEIIVFRHRVLESGIDPGAFIGHFGVLEY
jgi:hypothetical protein